MNKTLLQINVNGQQHQIEIEPDMTLVDVLREKLGLTGTKKGCNSGECGACTVLLDGQPVASCVLPALKAQGKQIITVEGLGTAKELHPLQKAFLVHGAVQCGFCTPGMLMSAKALLDKNPSPTPEEIKMAISGNLCRCTGYKKIIDAVMAAAAELRGEKTITMPTVGEQVVGSSVPRVDGIPKVTGQAKFADDLSFPNMLYAKVLRSAHAHALIKNINTKRAKALPGVIAVLTADDVPGRNGYGIHIKDQPVLAKDKVRHYGDAVAVVAAETLKIAEQALELIEVDYEPLPGVFTVEDALKPGAPKIHPNGNLVLHRKVYKGDIEKGFQEADVIIEDTFKTPMVEHAYIEPEAGIGVYDGGKIIVYAVSQGVHYHRSEIAANLNYPVSKIRVVQTTTGGGFGGKIDNSVHILVALLALKTGRPVKLTYTRAESIIASTKRHPFTMRYKLGARKDGKLVAAEVEIYGDTGAYNSYGTAVLTRVATCALGPYEVPNVKIDTYTVYTNNPVSGAMRAFGAPQAAIAHEAIMDELAKKIGISPVEIRRINAFRKGSATPTGQILNDGVGILETIERAVEKSGMH
ncbi:molybdopterin cofactor-binding domain-containing protein [Desulfallas sp. Bu1-1]|uniref:molybdopterin cofactor-binding domain-containing protein n=1 Tax=Desulfallas sp. Bu1-1 TaxID=2787620 RepID=UPI001A9BCF84|nr:molybdopterin cofactor-binding domain-containing protein [Desulfallas sp. Bu1-1]